MAITNDIELRRGNYIYLLSALKNIQSIKVVTATNAVGVACNDGLKGKGLESARYESGRILPIPITPTWLYLCKGYVKEYPIAGTVYHLSQSLAVSANLCRDMSGNYEGFLLNFKIGDDMKTILGLKPILYVHQLQNIFFDLTQESLNFKTQ